ncbi:LysR family transcriptional regulator [Endozoicomonadaceae bacterium StTr2]
MINPVWLNTFKKLVETGHFTRTAEQLAMTQPGVSQHINKLENHFDCILLQRQGKGFELTPAGREVYQFACSWLQNAAMLEQRLVSDPPYEGELRLASPGAVSLVLYPQLTDLQVEHKELVVNFEVAPNQRIINSVIENKVDIGWVTINPVETDLMTEFCCKQKLVVVAHAEAQINSWDELLELGFINHPDGFYHASLVFEKNMGCKFAGIQQLKVSGHINQLGQILDPVASGIGFTVLPESVVQSYTKKNHLKLVDLDSPVYESVFIIQKKRQKLPSRYSYMLQKLKL